RKRKESEKRKRREREKRKKKKEKEEEEKKEKEKQKKKEEKKKKEQEKKEKEKQKKKEKEEKKKKEKKKKKKQEKEKKEKEQEERKIIPDVEMKQDLDFKDVLREDVGGHEVLVRYANNFLTKSECEAIISELQAQYQKKIFRPDEVRIGGKVVQTQREVAFF